MEDKFLNEIMEHQPLIHKVCRLYRDTSEDREDLFQEIVYQLWKSYLKFENRSTLATWIYRISLNTAMATFRKPRVKISGSSYLPENLAAPDSMEESREERFFSVVKRLDDSERALVALYLEDMSYAEIGDIIGISESNVGVRLNRIKKKLRTLLNK